MQYLFQLLSNPILDLCVFINANFIETPNALVLSVSVSVSVSRFVVRIVLAKKKVPVFGGCGWHYSSKYTRNTYQMYWTSRACEILEQADIISLGQFIPVVRHTWKCISYIFQRHLGCCSCHCSPFMGYFIIFIATTLQACYETLFSQLVFTYLMQNSPNPINIKYFRNTIEQFVKQKDICVYNYFSLSHLITII